MRSLQFSVPMSRSPVAVRAPIPPPKLPFVAVSGAFDGGGWEMGWSLAEALLGRGDAGAGSLLGRQSRPGCRGFSSSSPHLAAMGAAGKAPLTCEPRPGENKTAFFFLPAE